MGTPSFNSSPSQTAGRIALRHLLAALNKDIRYKSLDFKLSASCQRANTFWPWEPFLVHFICDIVNGLFWFDLKAASVWYTVIYRWLSPFQGKGRMTWCHHCPLNISADLWFLFCSPSLMRLVLLCNWRHSLTSLLSSLLFADLIGLWCNSKINVIRVNLTCMARCIWAFLHWQIQTDLESTIMTKLLMA